MAPMPMPMNDEEDHDTFMRRCMGDGMMKEEYPDDQREAVCQAQWDKVHEEGDKAELHYRHILTAAASATWAILPSKLATIMNLLTFRASGGHLTPEEIQMQIGAAARPQQRQAGAIAVLPLYGTIIPRGNMLMESSGATSVERFTQAFRQAMADPQVGGVLLDVDSPGGMVQGVGELADEIYRARGVKPVVAIANNLCASAAFWLATAADELYVTPSGEAGSVGVLAMHEDMSKALEQQGVKVSVIHSSRYKAEGMPHMPLSEEARSYTQSRVDEYHGDFVAAVARGRSISASEVEERYGQGRLLGARAAKAAGMVDGVMTYDEALRHLGRRMKQMPGARAEGSPMTIDAALAAGLNPILVTPEGVLGPTESIDMRAILPTPEDEALIDEHEGMLAEATRQTLTLRRRRLELGR